jgi:hypothetical protein
MDAGTNDVSIIFEGKKGTGKIFADLCAEASRIFFGTPGTGEKIVFLANFFKPLIKFDAFCLAPYLVISREKLK